MPAFASATAADSLRHRPGKYYTGPSGAGSDFHGIRRLATSHATMPRETP